MVLRNSLRVTNRGIEREGERMRVVYSDDDDDGDDNEGDCIEDIDDEDDTEVDDDDDDDDNEVNDDDDDDDGKVEESERDALYDIINSFSISALYVSIPFFIILFIYGISI